MRGPGILWMLQMAAGFSMAGPMFVVGVEFLRTGRFLAGALFLAIGAVALYLPTYIINRIGGPRAWIRRRLPGRGSDGDDEDDGRGECEGSALPGPLERLRRR